ncbi:MAG: 50S ribosomal protein L10 [bacterium]|nr:50S ribosomal protein L10 [Planctomycetota bacterium]HIL51350.1 50S ribosomal protein L10 [Planctomycetota bacterium]
MPNLVNELISKELASEFEGLDGLLIVSFGGLTVEETESLRDNMAEKGVSFRMVPNKLARRILAEKGLEFDRVAMSGNTAVAYGDAEAAINAAKILTEPEVKKAGKVKIKGGMLEQIMLDAEGALLLANIPDRDTLRAKILGCLSGPARGIVGTIHAVPSGLARVLQAHADQEGDE